MADEIEDVPELVESQLSPEEAAAKLTTLKASATKEYSLKNYGVAADLYSEATELQAQVHGEMSPQNAELLYAYGRCLYHVAISKSDVLGSKVAGGDEPQKKKRKTNGDSQKPGEDKLAENIVETAVEEAPAANKPFFQITGDENWTDSEDEDEDGADGEAEDEDDDFANAYEVLDLARVLLTKQIESIDHSNAMRDQSKGKSAAVEEEITGEKRSVMERLSDTLDLQAEIWLESERFSDAVPDFQSALELKLRLFPPESSLVAEAHYKLSLALEFASIRQTEVTEASEAPEKAPEVDEDMRREAASHMEKAIASCRLRVEKETALLDTGTADEKTKKEKNIKEVKDMISDLEQRLTDLRNPATAPEGGPAGAPNEMLGGILGSILGESAAEQKARIAEATRGANDLGGLVKKKKKKQPAAATAPAGAAAAGKVVAPAAAAPEGSALKRKLADDAAESGIANGKKAKVEDEV